MSGKIRFISDPHFGHKNIAIKRGFQDEFYHDEHIIDTWNSIVNKRDTTWILGDITMEKNHYEILNKLNGYKRIILGNHDLGKYTKYLINHINSIHGLTIIRSKEYGSIFLSHCPIHPQELEYRVKYNIHGHIHENTVTRKIPGFQDLKEVKDERYINVCMEMQHYKPKTLEELIK